MILPGNAVYKQHEQGYKMQVHIEAHFVVQMEGQNARKLLVKVPRVHD